MIACHWVGIVADNKAGPDGFGYMLVEKAELFYRYDGLIDSINQVWLLWGLEIPILTFDWVNLRTSMEIQ